MTALKDRALQGLGMLRVAREPERVSEIKKIRGESSLLCITEMWARFALTPN